MIWFADWVVRTAKNNIRLLEENKKRGEEVRSQYEKRFCDPLDPPTEETMKRVEEVLKKGLTKNEDKMEEKKTKRMTLNEFKKWLNEGCKVYVNGKAKELLYKLEKAGITESKDYKYHECCAFCTISLGTSFWMCDMAAFAKTKFKEISVEDILSVEFTDDVRFAQRNSDYIELEKWVDVVRDKFCSNGWSFVISASNFALIKGDLIEERQNNK